MTWPFGDLPRRSFNLIAADPAWSFKTYSAKGHGKSAQKHYACMTLDDIKALPVRDLAASDCGLFLWATAPMLTHALEVMSAWGFSYKTHGVWCKTTASGKPAFGTGYRLRGSHEIFLVGTIGNPKNTRGTRSVITAPRREHSRKPDQFFAMAEQWLPDARRVELFSRQTRLGWSSWGTESGLFDEAELFDGEAA